MINKIKKYFAGEVVNGGRQSEVDLMKAILIVLLAVVHMFVTFSTDAELDRGGPRYFMDSVVGGPYGVPVFIFAMGIGLSYDSRFASKGDPLGLAKRGVRIYFTGLALNICRFLIPALIGYAITGDYAKYIKELPLELFENDILQFAAFAMIFIAFLEHLGLSYAQIMLVALIMQIPANLLNGIEFDSVPLAIVLGYFFGTTSTAADIHSLLPLFDWFIIYAFGALFGEFYKRLSDKKKFFVIVTPILGVISVFFEVLEYETNSRMMGAPSVYPFYHIAFGDVLLCITSALTFFGICYFISQILPESAKVHVYNISKNITIVYFIQWVIVCWIDYLIIYPLTGYSHLEVPTLFILGAAVSVISVMLASLFRKYLDKRSLKGAT